ncbi:MAG: response regulator transcription factor [Actinobacteria bacterium]|nr:response regulator transcription factor [Actinomycetota bacterium]MBV8958850.1 response regulator transcription factor [Actinomycetota bacterium]MBV9253364.1 response regulator transcription factor [Actinomycetota bacterium]MBV9665032.1 response regulator transcription factor [Actinomycetota bacterium]MBV9936023.1 response regulator transcription factor [Actinomycetota bacterium]
MSIRLLLADDHTMLREGLRRSMEGAGFDVVGEASDGDEAVRLAEELHPDVVLMDVSMPVMDGIEATRLLREKTTDTQVVMLTMHADADLIVKAVRAGASGYLVKDCTTDEVARTVRMAANGETSISPELAESMLQEAQDEIISKREVEVLQLIAEGASTPEVAERLYISLKTVKNHLASIYQKLDSRDRTQAVVRAVKMGIIRLD